MSDSTQEIIFRTVVDTGSSEQSVNKLNKSIKETDSSVDKMGSSFDSAIADIDKKVKSGELTMRQLSKAVKEYQSIAIQAGRESAVGQEALQRAAKLSDELGDLNNEVKALAHDGANMQAALQLGSTVTAGYGALQGGMALVGGESEQLQETFVKLTAIQSVLSGIEQVRLNLEKESFLMIKAKNIATKAMTVVETVYAVAVGTTTGAMKALRLAMLALPIIAIIAGVIALVGWLASLGDSSEDVEAANEQLTKSFEANSEAMSANQRAIERQIDNQRKLAEAQGASAEELLKIDQKKLATQETGRKREMKMLMKNLREQSDLYATAYATQDYELAKTIRENIEKNKAKYKELKSLEGQYQVDLKLLNLKAKEDKNKEDEQAAKEAAEAQKRRNEAARQRQKEHEQKLLDEKRLYEDLITLNIEDESMRRLAQLKLTHERELAEVVSKYGKESKVIAEMKQKQSDEIIALNQELAKQEQINWDTATARKEQNERTEKEREFASKKADAETRLLLLKEDFDAQQKAKADLALIERDEALMNDQLTMAEKYKIEAEYQDKLDQLKEEKANKELERRKRVEQAATDVTTKGLEAIAGLSDAIFAAKMSKLEKGSAAELRMAKKQFEINKKIQLAQAVVQGIQATLAAYSSGSAIPIVGAATGPLFAAFAAATAAANIVKIKNQTFESGSSTVSSVSSVSAPQIPDYNASTQTSGLQGSGNETTIATKEKPVMQLKLVDSDLKTHLGNSAKAEAVGTVG
jgi:hypothetical protein